MATTEQPNSAAVLSLIEGNGRYVSGQLKQKGCGETSHREGIAKGQAPEIAVLGCADSRVPVEMVFDVDAGEVFTVRVAGNVIDEDGLASLEYACKHLGTKTVIVLGHTKCGAVAACCGDQAGLDGHMPMLMQKIRPARNSDDPVAENVRIQLQTLQDAFKNSLSGVEIVGAVYDLETGKATFMDEELRLRYVTSESLSPPPKPLVEDDVAPKTSGFFCCVTSSKGRRPQRQPKIEFVGNSPKAFLLEGNDRYISSQLKLKGCGGTGHRESIAKGQSPKVAVLGCSDSRVPVEMIFDVDAGEIFTVRVAGNIVNSDNLASLEYACKHLGTKAIMILGHSMCGAVGACCGDWEGLNGHLPSLLQKIRPARGGVEPVADNVRLQVDVLQASFKSALSDVKILGGVFDLATGKVNILDEA